MIRRREFLTLLGGAAASWPLTAQGQQPAMPVVGFLNAQSPDAIADRLRAFRRGLKETGYVEGENVAIVYRFAENQMDRLPELAADLVRRRVAVIVVTGGSAAVLAVKAATTTIPIVFNVAEDPVGLGLVASLARPGGSATGINMLFNELTAKRLELLRELVPAAIRVAVLVNPTGPNAESTMRDVAAAARALGLEIQVHNATTSHEINAAFAGLVRERPDALFVDSHPFFTTRRVQLILLASRHAVPATYAVRELAEAGGLMSYGSNLADAWRHQGAYTGRILKGAKPTWGSELALQAAAAARPRVPIVVAAVNFDPIADRTASRRSGRDPRSSGGRRAATSASTRAGRLALHENPIHYRRSATERTCDSRTKT